MLKMFPANIKKLFIVAILINAVLFVGGAAALVLLFNSIVKYKNGI